MAKSFATRYAALSDRDLSRLFAPESWRGAMSFQDRLAACQEYENRLAARDGFEPRQVLCRPMKDATFGVQAGPTITMNEHCLRDLCFQVEYAGENGEILTRSVDLPGAGWFALDTVAHEHAHGLQEDCCSPLLHRDYVDPRYSDHDLYRIQGCEKEAFNAGNRAALEAIRQLQEETGAADAEAAAYLRQINAESYAEALQRAGERYNDPDIERTLARVSADRYYGRVDPNPSASYRSISAMLDRQLQARLNDLQNGGSAMQDFTGAQAIAADVRKHAASLGPQVCDDGNIALYSSGTRYSYAATPLGSAEALRSGAILARIEEDGSALVQQAGSSSYLAMNRSGDLRFGESARESSLTAHTDGSLQFCGSAQDFAMEQNGGCIINNDAMERRENQMDWENAYDGSALFDDGPGDGYDCGGPGDGYEGGGPGDGMDGCTHSNDDYGLE